MGRKGYGCTHYKQGCKFVIWKQSLGKEVSESMLKSLVEKGQTMKLKFTSDGNDPYFARMVLKDKESGLIELELLG
jgi:DNA topoisomerase-3